MKINENKKLIIDEKNSYIHTEGKLLTIIHRDDFLDLKKYDDSDYSIRLFLVRNGKVETKLIKHYKIDGFIGFNALKQICSPKTTPLSMDLEEKMVEERGTLILSYTGIVDHMTQNTWD